MHSSTSPTHPATGESPLTAEEPPGSVLIRTPVTTDGSAMWRLAGRSPGLDLNSPYTYLILCRHFSRTCLVAQAPEGLAGFVTGYLLPDRTDTLFVWQIAVASTHRRTGLGRRLIDSLLTDLLPLGIRHLQATVTPDNEASLALFSSVARDYGVECHQSPFFSAEDFPAEDNRSSPHQPELLLHLGAFDRSGKTNGYR